MKIVQSASIMFHILVFFQSFPESCASKTGTEESPYRQKSVPLVDFQNLLLTEVNNEMKFVEDSIETQQQHENKHILSDNGRYLQEDAVPPEAQLIFDHMIDHGWHMSASLSTNRTEESGPRKLTESEYEQPKSPFLVCSRSPILQSGAQRLHPLLAQFDAEEGEVSVVFNDDYQTCYHVTSTFENARYVNTAVSDDEYVIFPMVDLMKIPMNTLEEITKDYWSIPTQEELLKSNEMDNDWERIIHVGFSSISNDVDKSTKAENLLEDLKKMAKRGDYNRRRHLTRDSPSEDRKLHSNLSITEAFSLTAPLLPNMNSSRRTEAMAKGRSGFWTRSLENGLESEHNCKKMFEDLDIYSPGDYNGFDIILNPENKNGHIDKDIQESYKSSASNSHCIISLVIGLSSHPDVLNIEASVPTKPDDYESQWITQSNTLGSRPLFDVGLTGAGQIVSVTDSGLDIGHSFLGPTSSGVYKRWILSERKVVKYEHNPTTGDTFETAGGHGTRVAVIIAGKKLRGGDHEADGIAKDAKIHMWDIQKGNGGGFRDPGPDALFSEIYNYGSGAKITNGSWGSGYRPYSTRCQRYDKALNEAFNDILFVASSGNSGNDDPNKPMRTVGDPASCKNVLAVGASQSHGERVYMSDKGRDYLADFSSRGPTSDDRMKPDVVAPGYTLLTGRAHGVLNEEVYETLGTSFSSPVVAGCAALVRQYFEEGWFPCGSRGCSTKQNPSGALIKAVLANGARDLKMVQKVPMGEVTETIQTYDNHAGMGLVNMLASLPIRGKNDLDAVAVNNKVIGDGDMDTITITWTSCKHPTELSVTLAWYDVSGAPNCAKCLLNDLDLFIERVDSSGKSVTSQGHYPNGLINEPDKRNNMERIRIQDVSIEERYKISVKATNLSSFSQKYSLFATGCFDVLEERSGVQCSTEDL